MICVSSGNIFSHGVTLYNFYRYLLIILWDYFRGQTEGEQERTFMWWWWVSMSVKYCSFVLSYCVILLPKPDSQRTHEFQLKDWWKIFFYFLVHKTFPILFYFQCFALWVNLAKMIIIVTWSCQTAATLSVVSRQYRKCVRWIFFQINLFVHASTQTIWRIINNTFLEAKWSSC